MASHHVARPAAAAVDFGSGCVRLWTSGGGNLSGPAASGRDTSAPLVRHGRVLDEPGCVALLSRLIGELDEPVPAGGVVVACRPVLSTPAEQQALRRVLTEVLAPSRLLLIDTVRAAAIGAGAAAGGLLVVDVGAQLTEVALLEHGRVVAARRTDLGTRDLGRGAGATVVAEAVTRMIGQLRGVPAAQPLLSAATRRGVLLVGDGATRPALTAQLVTRLRMPVHCAASPHRAAVNGAGVAAAAALRHPGVA